MSTLSIIAYMFSGIIGMALFAWGKNLGNLLIKTFGMLLMMFPMFSSNPWAHIVATIALVALSIKIRD